MHRILFLDFDGVLHGVDAEPHQYLVHAPVLAQALADADCEIVISSAWRYSYPLESLRLMLPPELGALASRCTGRALTSPHARYDEILAHLAQRADPVDWRALDDSRYEFPEDCRNLIACDPQKGLGRRQLRELRQWLGRG